ncbi:hypothetical protein ACIBIZ_17820 [Nonomuraea spiralis]|uniref:hypothetical protein n=1 Tax=Nonomuraea TaxID=83681 RepID=UPI000F7A5E0F|nr:hypothetical protein [Nonomuraea sp. WAC 01424]RSN02068.1 hypothetical protein DMB42_38665 [Nonomuraea sp. WAC 01424]
MIKTLVRTGAAALASAAVLSLVAASPAAAGSDWNGCKSGNVCLYTGASLTYQTPGPIPDGKRFFVIVNNGNYDPGRDHVHFQYQRYGSSTWQSKCLHYRPDSGSTLDLGEDFASAQIRNMYWGGEC